MGKYVMKTSKGWGPIRKLKVGLTAGAVSVVISPFLEPLLVGLLGDVPDGAVRQISETLIGAWEVAVTLFAAYMARPGDGDEPVRVGG